MRRNPRECYFRSGGRFVPVKEIYVSGGSKRNSFKEALLFLFRCPLKDNLETKI
jgi:hypothetical protein